MERRQFITGALAASGLAAGLGGAPAALAQEQAGAPEYKAIRGRVIASGGEPVARAVVSDGYAVSATDAEGRFELPPRAEAANVFVSVPSRFKLSTRENSIAQIHRSTSREEIVFELTPRAMRSDKHAFIVLADPQTEDAQDMARFHAETVPDVAQTVKDLGAQEIFGVANGDIMWDHLELFPEYERGVLAMGVPFFQVLGNHDMDPAALTDDTSAATFAERFGPTYYSFNRGQVHYVVLDDVFGHANGYLGYLTDQQLHWLAQDLAFVKPGGPVVVFTHIPPTSTIDARKDRPLANVHCVTNRKLLYDLLAPFAARIISGHTHENEHLIEGNRHEHILGAACGAWWMGHVCSDGSPNGYGVFEVEGTTIRARYKGVGHPAEHQMRIYPKGADPALPDAILANVWDWNPRWRVEWSEDGQPRGAMTQCTGMDPLARDLYENPTPPLARAWVKPSNTAHLFQATPAANAKQIEVEATDEHGRVYRDTLNLA